MIKDQEIIEKVFEGKTYRDLETPDDSLRRSHISVLEGWAKEQEDELESLRAMAIAEDLRLYHSSYHNNSFRKQLRDISYVGKFKELGVEASLWKPGLVVLNGRFIYAIPSGKWRVVNSHKWYRCKSPRHLVETYVTR